MNNKKVWQELGLAVYAVILAAFGLACAVEGVMCVVHMFNGITPDGLEATGFTVTVFMTGLVIYLSTRKIL